MNKKIHFDTIDSTNKYLKEHYFELVDFSIVYADHQTQGRGRLGKIWIDDSQSALFSILLKEHISVNMISILPLIVGVAVHKTLIKYIPDILIKWPNDLIVGTKKLVGILLEGIIEQDNVQAIVIGIGINVNNDNFPSELDKRSTSLFLETKRKYIIEEIIDEVADKIREELQIFNQDKMTYLHYCNMYSAFKGKEISFIKNGKSYVGKYIEINADGSLLVNVDNHNENLYSGEVTLCQNYQP